MKARGLLAVAAVVLLLAGCQAGAERLHFDEDGFSIDALGDGWGQSRTRGSVVFDGPARDGLDAATIVIRAVPLRVRDVASGRREAALPATAFVLAQLPDAAVTAGKVVSGHGMRGRSWHVRYRPPGKTKRYERRHAALLGTRHIFHVFATAPEHQLRHATGAYKRVVASIREGVAR